MEAAKKEARDFSGIKNVHPVHSRCLSPRPHHTSPQHQRNKSCYRCGGNHNQANCSFTNEECFYCHKRGHIAAVCLQKRRNSKQPRKSPQEQQYQQPERKQNKVPRKFEKKHTNMMEETTEFKHFSEYQMYNCCTAGQPLLVELLVQGVPVSMEVDTGATLSIISCQIYNTAWTRTQALPIKPSNVKQHTWG